MSFFELVFYFVLVLSILLFASIVNSLAGHRLRSALRTFRVFLVLAAVYAAVLITTTLATPIRTLPMTEPQFLGDWSIVPTNLRRNPHDLDETYEVDFRLSNRGARPVSGPKGLIVYLLSEDGTRYNPIPDTSNPPFDAAIQPGKWVSTTRTFVLPTNLNRVELVMTRTGFRLDWFIIGRRPFDGRTVMPLQ